MILVNGRPVQLPVEPVIRAAALLLAIAAAFISGTSFVSNWPTLALCWYGKPAAAQAGIAATDPIFGRPIAFYLFALPALGAARRLADDAGSAHVRHRVVLLRHLGRHARPARTSRSPRRLCTRALDRLGVSAAGLRRPGVSRPVRADLPAAPIFTGVTYTDAHVILTGLLVVSLALVAGALSRRRQRRGVAAPDGWCSPSCPPQCAIGTVAIAGMSDSFIVKPNELVREQPYISHNIELTRQAFGLDRIAQRPFPAETERRGR